METQVEFRTKMFPERPGEREENVNEFVGKAFCEWIRDELPRHGQETENNIIAEDFGWLCYLKCEFPLWIGCNNHGEDETGMTSYTAIVAAEPRRGLFRKGPDPKPALEKAAAAFKRLIESEPKIEDVKWVED